VIITAETWAGSHFAPSRKMKFVAGAPRNQLSFQVTVVEKSAPSSKEGIVHNGKWNPTNEHLEEVSENDTSAARKY
jgi:hypothetical protein